jgi:hypothetical protein
LTTLMSVRMRDFSGRFNLQPVRFLVLREGFRRLHTDKANGPRDAGAAEPTGATSGRTPRPAAALLAACKARGAAEMPINRLRADGESLAAK